MNLFGAYVLWIPSVILSLVFFTMVSFDEQQLLILMKYNWSLFLWLLYFVSCLRNLYLLQDHEVIFLYFILEALLFYPLHLSLKPNDSWGRLLLGNHCISFHLDLLIFFLNILSFHAIVSGMVLLIQFQIVLCW